MKGTAWWSRAERRKTLRKIEALRLRNRVLQQLAERLLTVLTILDRYIKTADDAIAILQASGLETYDSYWFTPTEKMCRDEAVAFAFWRFYTSGKLKAITLNVLQKLFRRADDVTLHFFLASPFFRDPARRKCPHLAFYLCPKDDVVFDDFLWQTLTQSPSDPALITFAQHLWLPDTIVPVPAFVGPAVTVRRSGFASKGNRCRAPTDDDDGDNNESARAPTRAPTSKEVFTKCRLHPLKILRPSASLVTTKNTSLGIAPERLRKTLAANIEVRCMTNHLNFVTRNKSRHRPLLCLFYAPIKHPRWRLCPDGVLRVIVPLSWRADWTRAVLWAMQLHNRLWRGEAP